MGKVYGVDGSGNKLIIDGDAIDQRLSDLEANWESLPPTKIATLTFTGQSYGNSPAGSGSATADLYYSSETKLCELRLIPLSSGGSVSGGNKTNSCFVCDVSNYDYILPSMNLNIFITWGLDGYDSISNVYKLGLVIDVKEQKLVIQLQATTTKDLMNGWNGNASWNAV